jgi:hypothetical protein
MKNIYLHKIAIALMIVLSYLSAVSCSNGAEKEKIRTIAENFVVQICNKKLNVILQSYQMTDEFYIVVSDTSNIVQWSSEIDKLFGQLENVVNSEVVDHEKNLRSVYLYYQGTKRPAKVWVTFSGTDIAGIHWDLWIDGYDENVFSETWNSLFWFLFVAYCFIYSISCIFFGERMRKKYVQKLRSDYQYHDEHLLSSYTESQNPSWCFLLCHGVTLPFVIILCFVLLTSQIVFTIGIVIIITVLILVILLCELLPLLMVGFFIEVDDRYLTIRMGTFRLRVLRLELKNIQSVETVNFRPIRDFGGWGLRMGSNNGWAYFMSGTEGVQITTTNQQKYIIGSDIPDRLAKVVLGKIHSIKNYD